MSYKVLYNNCYGGFCLSQEAIDLYINRSGIVVNNDKPWGVYGIINGIERHDKLLVSIVEELGSERASGSCSRLGIETISCHLYKIEEYDGNETVIQNYDDEWRSAK